MPETILIVDDDARLRQELKCSLDEYDIIEAQNGQEALRIINKPNGIDLVILDVKMPGLVGTEVLKLIKKREPGISVVIFTAFSSKDTAIESLRGEADEYLEKPVDIDYLKRVIEKLLEKKCGGADLNVMGIKGKIEKVKRFLERNCYKKVSLSEAASVVSMSPKYLSKIFSDTVGASFVEYKLKMKIEKAKELLNATGMNISQLSDKFAFQNPESFMRLFKKTTGRTPSQYRKSACHIPRADLPDKGRARSEKTGARNR